MLEEFEKSYYSKIKPDKIPFFIMDFAPYR